MILRNHPAYRLDWRRISVSVSVTVGHGVTPSQCKTAKRYKKEVARAILKAEKHGWYIPNWNYIHKEVNKRGIKSNIENVRGTYAYNRGGKIFEAIKEIMDVHNTNSKE